MHTWPARVCYFTLCTPDQDISPWSLRVKSMSWSGDPQVSPKNTLAGHVCTKFKLLFSLALAETHVYTGKPCEQLIVLFSSALAKTHAILKISFPTCFCPHTGVKHISAPLGHGHTRVFRDLSVISNFLDPKGAKLILGAKM